MRNGSFIHTSIVSISKKVILFPCLCHEGFNDKAFEFLKIKESTFVNDFFQNENNSVCGVFLHKLVKYVTLTKKQFSFLLYVLLLTFLYSSLLYSQPNKLSFKHITTADGLSNSNILCILHDSQGYMWFATEDGLNKYDGTKFTLYNDKVEHGSLSNNFVRSIIEDENHDLWIATDCGLNKYDRKKDVFISFLHNDSIPRSISNNSTLKIIQDKKGLFWIGTANGDLNIYDRKKNSFSVFKPQNGKPFNPEKLSVSNLIEDYSGKIWINYMNFGYIDIINEKRSNIIRLNLDAKNDKDEANIRLGNIIEDKANNIWIATDGSGLYKIYKNENNAYTTIFFKINPDVKAKNERTFIKSLIEDIHGGLWIGFENKGLVYFDTKKNTFKLFNSDTNNSSCLSNNSVWSIYQDKDKGLWVGTFSTGLNYSSEVSTLFGHVKNNPTEISSLSHNFVSSFLEDHDKTLWIGTDGGGLNKYNSTTKTYTSYNTLNSNISSNAVLSIFEDSKNNLWIGTWGGGINLMNRKTGSFTHYTNKNSNLISNNYLSIIEDRNGTVWFGSFWGEGGLCYYDPVKNDFTSYTTSNSGLINNTIDDILLDHEGYLWLATQEGLNKFNPRTKKFNNYYSDSNDSTTLSNSIIQTVIETKDSTIWIGTANGLNSYDEKTGKFKRYLANEYGFPHEKIMGIQEDENGNLWVSSKNGLSRFNPKTNTIINYTTADGLQGIEFFRKSAYKSKDGHLYFGGTNGFNYFDPSKIKDTKIEPPIYITNLKIFNKPVNVGDKNSPLTSNISFLDTLVLSYKQSVFTIEYAAINYIYPEKTQFAYMLEGLEKDWNYVKNQQSATYTNLDPGTYIFKIKIPYSNGVVNEIGKSLVIIITPPYYKTWWFRLVGGLLLLSIFIGFYYYRISQINKTNKLLEHKVLRRTHEINIKNELLRYQKDKLLDANKLLEDHQLHIEQQSEELKTQMNQLFEVNTVKDKLFSIIAHDLKNPFNSLNGFAELLHSNYDEYPETKRKKMIEIIHGSSSKIYQLLEHLLIWSRAQRGAISYSPINGNLIELINNNLEIATNQALAKQINITFNANKPEIIVNYDPNLIDTVLRNLLSNAIKFTPQEGHIRVSAILESEILTISITDSGVGISEENQEVLFKDNIHYTSAGTENETGTGLGLSMCNDFILLHGGKIWVQSSEGEGSTFSFTIPMY